MVDFFSRSISLCDSVYCFLNKEKTNYLKTLNEKVDLLNYNTVINQSLSVRKQWTKFEAEVNIPKIEEIKEYSRLIPDNSIMLTFGHPFGFQFDQSFFIQQNEPIYIILIDHTNCFEWANLNSIYKNSTIRLEDLQYFKYMNDQIVNPKGIIELIKEKLNSHYIDDKADWLKGWIMSPDMYKIHRVDLDTIAHGNEETFLHAYNDACNFLNINDNKKHITDVLNLYRQWYSTSLKKEDIVAFKKEIGIIM